MGILAQTSYYTLMHIFAVSKREFIKKEKLNKSLNDPEQMDELQELNPLALSHVWWILLLLLE